MKYRKEWVGNPFSGHWEYYDQNGGFKGSADDNVAEQNELEDEIENEEEE